jgi:hypothetical protein
MISKGVLLLFLATVVLFIIYIASSEQTMLLSQTSSSPGGIAIFAPVPGTPPLGQFLPMNREGFTVKFGKRNSFQQPLQNTEVQTDCEPPPPPPQQVETVDIQYRHGERFLQETAESTAQRVNQIDGVRILQFNPLMINNNR